VEAYARGTMDLTAYETKFADFLAMCADNAARGVEGILIDEPLMLGDTYEEVVESLNRLADAKLTLMIRPRAERG
jgi:hypothetical protein